MLWCHHHCTAARFLCCHTYIIYMLVDGAKVVFSVPYFYPYIHLFHLCAFREWAICAVCGTGSDPWFVWGQEVVKRKKKKRVTWFLTGKMIDLAVRWSWVVSWDAHPDTKAVTNPCRPKDNRCWWSTRREHLSAVYPFGFCIRPDTRSKASSSGLKANRELTNETFVSHITPILGCWAEKHERHLFLSSEYLYSLSLQTTVPWVVLPLLFFYGYFKNELANHR
jgi:hypothetical protein